MRIRWFRYMGPREDLWPPIHVFWNARPYIGIELCLGRRIFSITWANRETREHGW